MYDYKNLINIIINFISQLNLITLIFKNMSNSNIKLIKFIYKLKRI